ncbi:nucleotidyltransferase family protein [Acidihalobacter ferrooxydans]|uniref:MobA-like NTP transferase domain-containing protein n=1 Tax=Acidihalobacter ferrooxydans TaxID=1765967 RepID=A0A1P8UHF6_9GAMM|nr:nucleotidyltransferase family protein [Acidihalobacter ferrooxydans]APZ43276.1 hypothetical protein BW247_09360 [Acidihalobacter ferrooxydans]
MIGAVILAGGQSRRSGRIHKACRLLPGERRSWLDRQIDALRAAGIIRIVLVLGYRPRRVLTCLHRNVSVVSNPNPERGAFAALQSGLASGRGDRLIVPLDTPLPNAMRLRQLIKALHGVDAALPTDRRGRGSHPVALTDGYAQGLRAIAPTGPDARLDRQLHALSPQHCRRLRLYASSQRHNLNTPRAWRAYLNRRRGL